MTIWIQNQTRYALQTFFVAVHTCEACGIYANQSQELDDSKLFCFFKAYENASLDTFGNLKIPTDDFVYFISQLENIFQNNFEELSIANDIIKKLIVFSNNILFTPPCNKFPKRFLVKLYFRLRIFYTLKFINRNFKSINKNKLIIWKHQ